MVLPPLDSECWLLTSTLWDDRQNNPTEPPLPHLQNECEAACLLAGCENQRQCMDDVCRTKIMNDCELVIFILVCNRARVQKDKQNSEAQVRT